MDLNAITSAFYQLGKTFSDPDSDRLQQTIEKAQAENLWFTRDSIQLALLQWADTLTPEALENWVVEEGIKTAEHPKDIGIVMAGNVPLVGLHDLLSVLITGNRALIKLSSQDKALMELTIDALKQAEPELEDRIQVMERLKGCDAYIATGSNNTSRYFEYYFRDKPSIIRKNRNSLAILSGEESDEELHQLGHDIFNYFGLGCRNVTHLLLPNEAARVRFYDGIEGHNGVIHHNKYANNYTYHKALFLMNRQDHLDNNFLLLKEDQSLYSPIGCLFYSYYNSDTDIQNFIRENEDRIQVIVGGNSEWSQVAFGKSQKPSLMDYADNVNTIAFLSVLK